MISREIITAPTVFKYWMSKCKQVFSLDTETTSLKYLKLEIIGFSICDGTRACYVDLLNEYAKRDRQQFLDILQFYINESRLIIFHNASYDLQVLRKYGIEVSIKIFDTLSSSHLLDENREHNNLKYLAETVLGIPKEQIKKYTEVTPGTHEFAIYGMNDAIWTFQLYKKFAPEIDKQGLHHLAWDIEFPFQYVLMELAINGIAVDKKAAKEMLYETRHLYYQIENELLSIFGGKYEVGITTRSRQLWCEPSINFNSSKQVVPLVESLGFEITERSDGGEKSWGKETKNRLAGKNPTIDLLIKLGKIEKLIAGFLEPFEEFVSEDNRIHCDFNNTVAVTGRLSCSNPNIEQLPNNNGIANIRNLFIAESGNILIVADYKSQEIRIMAEESHDSAMKEIAVNGDLHQETADAVGLPRTQAKCIVFGTAYGKTAIGFSKDFNCSVEKAQEFIDKFLDRFPLLRQRIERCHQQVYLKEYVRNMTGRRRRFPGFKKMFKGAKNRCLRQAFNFIIQSVGADVVKAACVKIIKDINLKLVNIVHDEVVIECKKEYLEKGIEYIHQCMTSVCKMSIPWDVKITSGIRYGDCK